MTDIEEALVEAVLARWEMDGHGYRLAVQAVDTILSHLEQVGWHVSDRPNWFIPMDESVDTADVPVYRIRKP